MSICHHPLCDREVETAVWCCGECQGCDRERKRELPPYHSKDCDQRHAARQREIARAERNAR